MEMSRADVYVDVSHTRTVSRVPSVQLCLVLPHAVLYRGRPALMVGSASSELGKGYSGRPGREDATG